MQVLLTTAYLPPIQYFVRLYAAEKVYEERCDHYVKQTYRNRAVIAADSGPLNLTVPVLRTGENNRPMRDLEISDHGRWRQLHWRALTAAYDHSPYFFYYQDEFRPFYERTYRFLVDFNAALQAKVCELLSLSPTIVPTETYHKEVAGGVEDARELIHPKRPLCEDPHFRAVPYHQVFEQRHGFLSNMSILDLLFNMGPESRLILRASYQP